MKRRVRTREDGGEEREIEVKRQAKKRAREWVSGGSERDMNEGSVEGKDSLYITK